MTDTNSGTEVWEYVFPEGSPAKKGRSLRSSRTLVPTGIRRRADGDEFHVGDCVLLESPIAEHHYVGVIEAFVFNGDGDIELRTFWFRRLDEISQPAVREAAPSIQPGELFITRDGAIESPDVLKGHATVLGSREFGEDTTNTTSRFLCRRAFNPAKGLFSDEFEWSSIYSGRSTDMIAFSRRIDELLPKPTRRSTRAPRKASYQAQGDDGSDDSEDEYESAEEGPEKRKVVASPETPRKKRASGAATPRSSKKSTNGSTTPRTPKSKVTRVAKKDPGSRSRTKPTAQIEDISLPLRTSPVKEAPTTPHRRALARLHMAKVPESLPCRDNEFSEIFLALEGAIASATGSCIYVSGTPGTGKTATIREVIAQLQLRCEDGELSPFTFLEVNGMKLTNPHTAYELLWEHVSGEKVSASSAMLLLEKQFRTFQEDRVPTVLLMDELDQLVTKNQGVMYNFFNWPSLADSRLIVIAVANTMDLPERMLSNKISSRLGLTRIQFSGYTYEQLREIITSRLGGLDIVERDAVEFAARKIAGVSGDARRALDICQRAVEMAEARADSAGSRVTITHIKMAINESTSSPMNIYLQSLPMTGKVFLCALVSRVRRTGVIDNPLADVLQETERIVRLSPRAEKLTAVLFGGYRVRMVGFLNALSELVEGGVLVQQNVRGERSANIRLSVGEDVVKHALMNDKEVSGMI